MPEVCRWTMWTLSPCFLSYTQVYLFCQQKSAAWSTMPPFYNSGDVVLPCEIIVVEISPPLWQKGMPMPLFSYIARHVSCKKKCWKCQEWINCLFVCMDALKNPLGLPLGASLQFFQKKYLSLANHCHVDPFIHLFYALLKSWKEENIRIYHVFWPDCCHLV